MLTAQSQVCVGYEETAHKPGPLFLSNIFNDDS